MYSLKSESQPKLLRISIKQIKDHRKHNKKEGYSVDASIPLRSGNKIIMRGIGGKELGRKGEREGKMGQDQVWDWGEKIEDQRARKMNRNLHQCRVRDRRNNQKVPGTRNVRGSQEQMGMALAKLPNNEEIDPEQTTSNKNIWPPQLRYRLSTHLKKFNPELFQLKEMQGQK